MDVLLSPFVRGGSSYWQAQRLRSAGLKANGNCQSSCLLFFRWKNAAHRAACQRAPSGAGG